MNKSNLPTLADLNKDIEAAFKNDQFNLLLNQHPPASWVKEHPFAKGVKYIPVDKIEFLLTRIFQQWRCEVIEYKQLFNSVSCHIRLHYLNPVNGEWSYQDGVAAVDVQTKSGASPAELDKINSNAVMKALPAAKSYALKDAAELLGELFGKNLNRKDIIAFIGAYDKPSIDIISELFEEVKHKLTIEELDSAERIINNKEQTSYKKLFNHLKQKQ
jgi:hypothetical protein